MNLNDSHYEKFTPRERLALFFDAMARNDYPEADRLADTCERKSYKMQDAAYLQNLLHIHLSCLHALLMISEAESRALAAGVSLVLAKEEDAKQIRDAVHRYAVAICELLGIWEAWQEFCGAAGVDPESVMRTCWGGVPRMVEQYPLLDSDRPKTIKADPEAKAEALSLFMAGWRAIQDRFAT